MFRPAKTRAAEIRKSCARNAAVAPKSYATANDAGRERRSQNVQRGEKLRGEVGEPSMTAAAFGRRYTTRGATTPTAPVLFTRNVACLAK
jgi:hypothetical protein